MPSNSIPPLSNNTNNAVRSLKILKQTKIAALPTASPDEACCICLQLYGPSHQAVTVLIQGCWHRFGKECLNKYLDSESPRNNTCPQCRCVWYIKRPAWSPRDTNTTEALAPFSIPRAPARIGSRTATHRTHPTLEQYQEMNNSVITSHLDEVFRRLDLIQDISTEQITSTADTRVRLVAIERRARRIHQDLQVPQQNTNGSALPSAILRGHEIRRRLGQPSQGDNPARRRWVDAMAVELDDDPYSLMGGANRSRTSLSRTVSLPEESQVITETLANGSSNNHLALRSPPFEDLPESEETSWHQLPSSDAIPSLSAYRLRLDSGAPVLPRAVAALPSISPSTSEIPCARLNATSTATTSGSVSASSSNLPTPTIDSMSSDMNEDRTSTMYNSNFFGSTPNTLGMTIHPALRSGEPPQVSQEFNVSDHTPHGEMRSHAWDTFQTTLARQTAAGVPLSPPFDRSHPSPATQTALSIPPAPTIAPTSIPSTPQPQRRTSLGNLCENPTLRASPSTSSRPSLSSRPQRRASTRDAAQSKGKPQWLRKLPRVSSLSSLREAILPGTRQVKDARAPQWPAATRSSVANEVFRSNYWADPDAHR